MIRNFNHTFIIIAINYFKGANLPFLAFAPINSFNISIFHKPKYTRVVHSLERDILQSFFHLQNQLLQNIEQKALLIYKTQKIRSTIMTSQQTIL